MPTLSKTKKKKMVICSRGHKFSKSSEQPSCPTCWPGRYKKKVAEKKSTKQYIH